MLNRLLESAIVQVSGMIAMTLALGLVGWGVVEVARAAWRALVG